MDVCNTSQQSLFTTIERVDVKEEYEDVKEENEDVREENEDEELVKIKLEYDYYGTMDFSGQTKNDHSTTEDHKRASVTMMAKTHPVEESSSTVRCSGQAVKKRTFDDMEDDDTIEEDDEVKYRNFIKIEENEVANHQKSFLTNSENSNSEDQADKLLDSWKLPPQRKKKKNKLCIRKPRSAKYTQDDMDKAIDEYEKGKGEFSIKEVADKYKIPDSTFRGKLCGKSPRRCGYNPANRLMSVPEEEVFINYIKGAAKRAMPLTKGNVLGALEDILLREQILMYARNCAKKYSKHERWWRNIRMRHPEIVFRSSETLATARKNISQCLIRQWFSDVETYLAEQGVKEILLEPSRIYNIDEIGFCLSPKTEKVYGVRGEKLCFEDKIQYAQKNISVLCTICADGSLLPPMIIYPQNHINEQISEKLPENYNFVVGKSEKGYITFETFYEYMANGFNNWLNKNNVKRPVLIFTDWHETKANVFLAKRLTELGIIMFGFLPGTTHFLQPLDVAVFKPLKFNWPTAAKDFADKNPDKILDQTYFAMVVVPLIFEKVTNFHIISGFSKCGLYPFDANKPDYGEHTGATQGERSSSRECGTMADEEPLIHKKVQVVSNIESDVKRIVYPSLEKQTKDDMFLYLKKYEPYRSISLDVKKFYSFKTHLVEPLDVVNSASPPTISTASCSNQQLPINPDAPII